MEIRLIGADEIFSHAAAGAILLWAYLAGRLIVTGAFLNAAWWRRTEEQPTTL